MDGIAHFVGLARSHKARGSHYGARTAMRQAQSSWESSRRGRRPNFSAQEWQEIDRGEIQTLMASARNDKARGSYDLAREAVRMAREIWSPLLLVPQPDLTPREWQEIDEEQIRHLLTQASQQANAGSVHGVQGALEQVQVIRRLTRALGPTFFGHVAM